MTSVYSYRSEGRVGKVGRDPTLGSTTVDISLRPLLGPTLWPCGTTPRDPYIRTNGPDDRRREEVGSVGKPPDAVSDGK